MHTKHPLRLCSGMQ